MMSANTLQHDCIRLVHSTQLENVNQQILFFRMSESPSKFDIKPNNSFSKFTFVTLAGQYITSEKLYHWSTPIDISEHYQLYLNELYTLTNGSVTREEFYNCTMPRFGWMCQYEFDYYDPNHSSAYEVIQYYYHNKGCGCGSVDFTCLAHLDCERDMTKPCLDWIEICDGQLDCSNGAFDEEHCWQLDIRFCRDDEHRCRDGRCIPRSFYKDEYEIAGCFHMSDEYAKLTYSLRLFECQTTICTTFQWRTLLSCDSIEAKSRTVKKVRYRRNY